MTVAENGDEAEGAAPLGDDHWSKSRAGQNEEALEYYGKALIWCSYDKWTVEESAMKTHERGCCGDQVDQAHHKRRLGNLQGSTLPQLALARGTASPLLPA